jgi:toxin HigB-1
MQVRFEDRKLERLEVDAEYRAGLSSDLVKAFRKRMQLIRSAPDEREFYMLKSLHFEKLSGKRVGQYPSGSTTNFVSFCGLRRSRQKPLLLLN